MRRVLLACASAVAALVRPATGPNEHWIFVQRHHFTALPFSTATKIITLVAAGLVGVAALVALLFISPATTDQSAAEDQAVSADETEAVDTTEAHREAEATIDTAHAVLASAATKVDTTALEASVSQLAEYKTLSLDRMVELTDHTRSTAQQTADALAEAEAAQAAADEAAAAEAAAAEAAAAEAAAAEAAAAEAAAAEAAAAEAAAAAAAAAADNSPNGARAIAADLAASQYGWGADQFACLDKLWTKESNWRVNADNPTSSAYGIPQALPGKKMASAGADWQTSARTQVTWGLGYIKSVYGTPCSAWSHSVANNWY